MKAHHYFYLILVLAFGCQQVPAEPAGGSEAAETSARGTPADGGASDEGEAQEVGSESIRAITTEDLVSPEEGAYARLEVSGRTLLVRNDSSDVPDAVLDDSDLMLDVGEKALLDVHVRVPTSGEQPDEPVTIALLDASSLVELAVGDFRAVPRTLAGVPLPPGMPSISLPRVQYCSDSEDREALQAYVRAAIQVWWLKNLLDRWNEQPESVQRVYWYSRMRDADGDLRGELSSLTRFFGEYADFRLDAIRNALGKAWNVYATKKTGGSTVRLHCPYSNFNACSSHVDPSANHIIRGRVDLCEKFFDYSEAEQTRVMAHELLHHLWVNWKDTIHRSDPIQDRHAHWEGRFCGRSRGTHTIYALHGEDRKDSIEHFAKYWRNHSRDCYHSNILFRTNNAYAFALRFMAGGWLNGATDWPGKEHWNPRRP